MAAPYPPLGFVGSNSIAESWSLKGVRVTTVTATVNVRVKNGSGGLAAGYLHCPGERTSSGCPGMYGLMHRSKLSDYDYSITASARTRIVSEMVIPRDFAVLRFTTRSNLAGRWMGRSLALVPPKIRPT